MQIRFLPEAQKTVQIKTARFFLYTSGVCTGQSFSELLWLRYSRGDMPTLRLKTVEK